MSVLYNNGTTLHSTNLERPRTDVRTSGIISAVNGALTLDLNGESTVSIDMRAAAISATFVVEGTMDGTNFIGIPFMNPLTEIWAATFTAAGQWVVPNIAAMRMIRIRCSAYTSGAATCSISASLGLTASYLKPIPTTTAGTIVGTVGAATTLTLASAGAGLFHYITHLRIDRFVGALLIAAATPVNATTTNLTGSLAFTFPSEAAALGTTFVQEIRPCTPLKSTTAATATTIVCPATTNVIWRITALYYTGA